MLVYPTIVNTKAGGWKTTLFYLFGYETISIYKNNYDYCIYHISYYNLKTLFVIFYIS